MCSNRSNHRKLNTASQLMAIHTFSYWLLSTTALIIIIIISLLEPSIKVSNWNLSICEDITDYDVNYLKKRKEKNAHRENSSSVKWMLTQAFGLFPDWSFNINGAAVTLVNDEANAKHITSSNVTVIFAVNSIWQKLFYRNRESDIQKVKWRSELKKWTESWKRKKMTNLFFSCAESLGMLFKVSIDLDPLIILDEVEKPPPPRTGNLGKLLCESYVTFSATRKM